jgi:hypothetical protein
MGPLNGRSAGPGHSDQPYLNGSAVPGVGRSYPPSVMASTSTPPMGAAGDGVGGDPRAGLEAERARLEREIAAAERATDAARRRAEDLNAALHAIVVESKERLADMEREHERHVEAIRAATKVEVERILDEARDRAGLAVPDAPQAPAHRSADGGSAPTRNA